MSKSVSSPMMPNTGIFQMTQKGNFCLFCNISEVKVPSSHRKSFFFCCKLSLYLKKNYKTLVKRIAFKMCGLLCFMRMG